VVGYDREQTLSDGRIAVTAALQSGQKMTWVINPDKGWNAERVDFLDADDDLISTVDVTLESFNGVWFPRQAVTYEGKRRNFLAAVDVLPDSRINDPALPTDLTLTHLGADSGFAVRDWSKKMSDRLATDVWDGQQMIAPEEFGARLMAGTAKMGPEAERIRQLTRERLEARSEGVRPADLPNFPDAWERYVRQFCETYRLDTAQIRAAEDILEKCQRRAVKLLERDPALREELGRLRAEKGKSREFFKLVKSFAANNTEKLKPVREIFETELQPRLFKLPTERQITDSHDPEKIKARQEVKPAKDKRKS
jgi:hypothetical protein